MKNWPNKIFYTDDVVVLNPYTNDQAVFWESEETDSLVNVSETLNKNIKESGNKDLELTLDKSQYGKREKVQLTVEAKSRIYGTYSVSVRKRSEEFGYGNRTSPEDYLRKYSEVDLNQAENNYLPELRGEIVSGSLSSDSGLETADKLVVLHCRARSMSLEWFQPIQMGSLCFHWIPIIWIRNQSSSMGR